MTRVLGITGGIGTGKSAAAAFFRAKGCAVFDADACVHSLLRRDGAAYPAVARIFPMARTKQGIDRHRLGVLVWRDPVLLRRLERIVHPFVRQAVMHFLASARVAKVPLAILDIPLLFEGGYHQLCDAVVCMTTTPNRQQRRVLQRTGQRKNARNARLNAQRVGAITRHQLSNAQRRYRADWVISTTTGGIFALHRVLARIGEKLGLRSLRA